MANREMCKKVLDYIKEHPAAHDQSVYGKETDCGTVMCVAGHAVILNGGSFDPQAFPDRWRDASGKSRAPWELGGEALGLTETEVDYLFGESSEHTALDMLQQLANGEEIV